MAPKIYKAKPPKRVQLDTDKILTPVEALEDTLRALFPPPNAKPGAPTMTSASSFIVYDEKKAEKRKEMFRILSALKGAVRSMSKVKAYSSGSRSSD